MAAQNMPTNAYIIGCLAGYGPRSMKREGYLQAYLGKVAKDLTAGSWRNAPDGVPTVDAAGAARQAADAKAGAQGGAVAAKAVPAAKPVLAAPAPAPIVAPNPNAMPKKESLFDALLSPTPFLRGHTAAEVQAANAARKAKLPAGIPTR